MFIAFCGIDGSGKTTIIKEIRKWLLSLGYDVKTLRPLKATSFYSKNFKIVTNHYKERFTENFPGHDGSVLLGFNLVQESERMLKTKKENQIVLIDRWTPCHEAYSYAHLIKSKQLQAILDSCLIPDMTFLINVDLNVALNRISSRNQVKEQESYPILYRARKKYLKNAETTKGIQIINNNDGELEKAIHSIKEAILERLSHHS